MNPSPESCSLDRRKSVRLCLRPGLTITPQPRGGEIGFVLKDPMNLRYFHLDENQRCLVEMMDGRRTLAEIQEAYEGQHRPNRLSLEELEAFSAHLLQNGLVHNESPLAGRMLYERTVRQQQRTFWLKLLNVLGYRVPLWNPDRVLTPLAGLGRFLFGPWMIAAALVFFSAAVALVVTHWRDLLIDLPTFQDFLGWRNLLLFWCILGVVKILHELGHGLCCKAMGGSVQGMGVMFLVLFPTLYCNVSDSWTISSKWRRIAISAAGIFVELWIAGVAALTWWLTERGTLIHHGSLALLLVCSVNTLVCNGNPLMRFDGYYILSDWLGAPNLAQQSGQFLQTACLRGLGFHVPWEEPQGRNLLVSRNFLILFGLASLVYRWLLLALTLFLIHSFFEAHRLGAIGLLVIVLGLGGMLASQLVSLVQVRRRFSLMKPARLYVASAAALGLILGFFLLPLPYSVHGVALTQVEPESAHRIAVTEPGFLREILVHDGQRVKAGETLAILASPKLEIKLRVNEADQALRAQQQKAFVGLLADQDLEDQDEWDTWAQNTFELRSLLQGQRAMHKQLERLVLKAPADGIVQGLQAREHKGKWLEKGTELCKVGNDRALRVLVLVDPAEQSLILRGGLARVHVHGGGSQSLKGSVIGIAQADTRNIPPQLSTRVGGNVATERDPVTKAEVPHSQHYLIAVRLLEHDSRLHPGLMGSVKIDAGAQTLWWRCRRFLGSTFSWSL